MDPLTVIIPVFNEGKNLEIWWDRARPHLPDGTKVRVVYDFDEDDTCPVARRLAAAGAPIECLRNTGRGLRSAILTGLKSVSSGPVIVSTADLSDDLNILPKMLDAYANGAKIVVASRYMRGGQQKGGPWLKRMLARWGSWALHKVACFPVRDATNCFRLYDAALLQSMQLADGGGAEISFEITLNAWQTGAKIVEVPTVWSDRTAGKSRFRLWKWLPFYGRLWLKALLCGMQQRTKSNAVFLVVVATIGLHVLFARLPFVNFEWTLPYGARCLANEGGAVFRHYFANQANTLGMPLLALFFHKLIPNLEIEYIPRLISISGFALLGWALPKLKTRLGSPVSSWQFVAIVFLNPLIWTFGGRGSADFFPAALSLFSFTLFWESPASSLRTGVSLVLFSSSVVLKYHSVLLFPLFIFVVLFDSQHRHRRRVGILAIMTLAAAFLPALYLLAMKSFFGFWVAPPKYQHAHGVELLFSATITNLISYAGYLTVLTAPLSLVSVWNRAHSASGFSKAFLGGTAAFLLGFLFLPLNGEMDFGPLNTLISFRVYSGAFCLGAVAFVLLLKDAFQNRRDTLQGPRVGLLISGFLCIVCCLSVTRPAQRYLLFVLPLLFCLLNFDFPRRRLLLSLTAACYIFSDAFISLSQIASGGTAADLTAQIVSHGLLADTDPDILTCYTGQFFPPGGPAHRKYVVVAGTNPQMILHAERQPFPLVHRAFSLVPAEVGESCRPLNK
jgi:dolichol-phosphate mannosyltransferase